MGPPVNLGGGWTGPRSMGLNLIGFSFWGTEQSSRRTCGFLSPPRRQRPGGEATSRGEAAWSPAVRGWPHRGACLAGGRPGSSAQRPGRPCELRPPLLSGGLQRPPTRCRAPFCSGFSWCGPRTVSGRTRLAGLLFEADAVDASITATTIEAAAVRRLLLCLRRLCVRAQMPPGLAQSWQLTGCCRSVGSGFHSQCGRR